MRLTRETLIKIARDTANQRARVSRRIICIYLTGSVLGDSPLLGGTTDIDLVIVQDSEPIQPREIIRLSDEIHLDIAYYAQSVFHQPRHLRTDPWLGPFIYSKPLLFHDTQHWFEFTQASTGAQFFQPDYIQQRASKLAQLARQTWMDLEFNPGEAYPNRLYRYLGALENAGNALVSLHGEPLTERRFFHQLPQRLQAQNLQEMTTGMIHLLAPQTGQVDESWAGWLNHWKEDLHLASRQADIPPRLQAARNLYYERAVSALWDENPTAALGLMMKIWALAAGYIPESENSLSQWQSAMQALGLDEEHFSERLGELDRYLDQVEETLDQWARSNGVSTMPEI